MIAIGWDSVVVMGDAALRGAAAAAVVAAGLWALRVRGVAAQKAAWTLVLAGATAMPLLTPLAARLPWMPAWIPDAATITDAANTRITAIRTRLAEAAAAQTPAGAAPVLEDVTPLLLDTAQTSAAPEASSAPHEMERALGPQYPAPEMQQRPQATRSAAIDIALALYLGIAAALLLRLLYGLASAIQLWAESYPLEMELPYGRVRVHNEITSPITIGSGILLPAEFTEWDSEKLRIVLAHESEHVRQFDFYLQLAAGIYAAIFWFSPLGWWLKRKLSDLGEAISDHAAVQQAESRTSYAQILLEFAMQPHATQMGVAMARGGKMTERMERLLNETRFQQAFAGGRARVLTAAVLAPLAVFAATTLARVEAKAQATQQPAPPTTQAPAVSAPQSAPTQAPATGVSHPDSAPIETAPEPNPAPAPEPAPAAPPTPPAPDTFVLAIPKVSANMPTSMTIQTNPDVNVSVGAGPSIASTYFSAYPHAYDYSYSTAQDRDSYAVISKDGQHVRFSGDYHTGALDKARAQAHGSEFLWFTRDGKQYIVDDPQVMAHIHELYQPMEALSQQMKAASKQQRDETDRLRAELSEKLAASGFNQQEFDRQMAEFRARQPEFNRQMAELRQEMATISVPQKVVIDQKQLDDIKHQMAQLQATEPDFNVKLNQLINQMAQLEAPKIDPIDEKKMAEINAKMKALTKNYASDQTKIVINNEAYKARAEAYKDMSDQMAKIGQQQGKLGGELGRAAHDADQQIRSIINESLKNGQAKPVN